MQNLKMFLAPLVGRGYPLPTPIGAYGASILALDLGASSFPVFFSRYFSLLGPG